MKWLVVWGLAITGCERADPCAGRSDMVQSAAGLAVTVDEHGVGWGQQDCALCHPSWNLHAHSCSESTIDMTRIDEHASLSEPETCTDCHGDNGVPEWEETDTGAE